MPEKLKETAIKLKEITPRVYKPVIAGGKVQSKLLSSDELSSAIKACDKCSFGGYAYDITKFRCKVKNAYYLDWSERLMCDNDEKDIYFKYIRGGSEETFPRKRISWSSNDK